MFKNGNLRLGRGIPPPGLIGGACPLPDPEISIEHLPLAADRVDILLTTDEDVSIGDRRRSIDGFANRIRSDDFVLRPGL